MTFCWLSKILTTNTFSSIIKTEEYIMEEDLIVAIWDMFLDFIPEKNRDQAANQYINLITKHIEVEMLEDLQGCDEYLDNAIDEVMEELVNNDDEDWFGDDL